MVFKTPPFIQYFKGRKKIERHLLLSQHETPKILGPPIRGGHWAWGSQHQLSLRCGGILFATPINLRIRRKLNTKPTSPHQLSIVGYFRHINMKILPLQNLFLCPPLPPQFISIYSLHCKNFAPFCVPWRLFEYPTRVGFLGVPPPRVGARGSSGWGARYPNFLKFSVVALRKFPIWVFFREYWGGGGEKSLTPLPGTRLGEAQLFIWWIWG